MSRSFSVEASSLRAMSFSLLIPNSLGIATPDSAMAQRQPLSRGTKGREGREEGRKGGREEGRKEGREDGGEEGWKEGRKGGREEGEEREGRKHSCLPGQHRPRHSQGPHLPSSAERHDRTEESSEVAAESGFSG